jgi:hypothetical protein
MMLPLRIMDTTALLYQGGQDTVCVFVQRLISQTTTAMQTHPNVWCTIPRHALMNALMNAMMMPCLVCELNSIAVVCKQVM